MKGILIGEKVCRHFMGEVYVFERVGRSEWKQISGSPLLPGYIKSQLERNFDRPS